MAKHIKSCVLIFLILCIATLASPSVAAYNVVNFGARSIDQIDSTQAFLRAWMAACKSVRPAKVYVPRGRFTLRPITFSGPCRNRIIFQIDGTIVAPWDYSVLGNSGFWILFNKVSRVSIFGGGLDARGAAFWACRSTKSSCPGGARSIYLLGSDNVRISGLTSINSQIIHIAIEQCNNVMLRNINIRAPTESPNTDGIHIQSSTGVTISGGIIRTGDDCVSIGPGTRNVWIEHIGCGPGHGISIGSLGNYINEDGVQNITVTNSVFTKTDNGVRIKSWARPSNGFARNIVFKNLIMKNVGYPIIIDEKYCPDNSCPHMSSGVKVSQVTYTNIKGTSSTPAAVTFNCNPSSPCTGIRMQDIRLTFENRPATTHCSNVGGKSRGIVIPKSCF